MSPNEMIATTLGGITLGTAIFQGALHIGKIINRVDRHDVRLEDHDSKLRDHGEHIAELLYSDKHRSK